jgi:hypothetical protein
MGYSARYHATSLIAVFIALAVGILVGAEFGGNALNNTRKDLEHSLVGNLKDERSRADELNADLNRSDEFAERVYPALVRERLKGKRYAILALGGLPSPVTDEVEETLAPTGGRLVGVGVVREPVDVNGLAEDLAKTRFTDLQTNSDALTELGTGLGRQLAIGGSLPDVVRGHLFSRASGNFGGLDGVIIVRDQPEEMGTVQREKTNQLETALMNGATATRKAAVGVETSSDDSSSISFFQSNGLASVDDIDLTAGKLATVFALLGADGSFGVKSSADQLLPDLLTEGE